MTIAIPSPDALHAERFPAPPAQVEALVTEVLSQLRRSTTQTAIVPGDRGVVEAAALQLRAAGWHCRVVSTLHVAPACAACSGSGVTAWQAPCAACGGTGTRRGPR